MWKSDDEPFYHEQLLPDCSLINQIITWINDIVKYADITYLRYLSSIRLSNNYIHVTR